MSLKFEVATAADLPLLLALVAEFYAEEQIAFNESATRRAIGELLGNPPLGALFLLRCDAAPAGYLLITHGFILEFGGRQMVLDELYLRPGFRGRGLGAEALAFAEQHCRANGVEVLRLEATLSNERALALYRQKGFVEHDRCTMTKLLNEKSCS
jgi:ribosomal protein S18 acetylase RimI-like enzyme